MIAFHGTSKKFAKSIKRTGFHVGTYFAYNRVDALGFGGPCLFTVQFSDDPSMWHGESDGWQFWTRIPIPPKAIVSFCIERN